MSKQILQMKYHPAKKEIFFARDVAGKDIPISSDSKLRLYMNECGKFILQDHGKQFFDDIADAFDGEKIVDIKVVTTKNDFEDFEQMVEYYNDSSQIKITATLLAELPDMEETYRVVRDHGEKSVSTLKEHRYRLFDGLYDNPNTKKCVDIFAADIREAVDSIQEKIEKMSDNSINLCFAGVYSAGKSALINAILGYQILPEAINSETARMFKIQSPKAGESPHIRFYIRDSYAELLWNEKGGTFEFGAAPTEDNTRKVIQETINNHKTDVQHRQIYEILKELNSSADVSADIKIYFPIPLDSDQVQFTIYDTPGTDSNFDEHQLILKDALSKQTHSILVFVAAPNKTEGAGNNALLSYLKEAENKDSKTSIDIGRSLFVVNWADSIMPDQRRELQHAKIKDKTDDSFSIKLSDKKLFFTSAKVAYAAKAKGNGIATEVEEYIIGQSAAISNKTFGCYYRQNRVATSELATQRMLAFCDEALVKAENSDNTPEVLHICSGLFALETEITAYGEKYAAAVRAFAIIDSVDKALSAMNRNAKSLERQNQEDINHIEQEIAELKSTIFDGINQACKKHALHEGGSLPKSTLLSLHLDSDYIEWVCKKTKTSIEEILQDWFWGIFGKVPYKEKHKADIVEKIGKVLDNYTTEFVEARQKLLVDIRDKFIKEVQDAIKKNGNLSEAAMNYVLDIPTPGIKIPKDLIAEFGNMYNEKKKNEKWLWMDTTHIDKKGFVKAVEEKMLEITTDMCDEFKKDYSSELTRVLSAIEYEFTQNIANYSVLMQAKFEDKKVMEQLRTKIADAARDLESCQEELNKVIWSVKENV